MEITTLFMKVVQDIGIATITEDLMVTLVHMMTTVTGLMGRTTDDID